MVKQIDKATPKLFVACGLGSPLNPVEIGFYRNGSPFYAIKLFNATISAVRTNAGSDGVTELVTFTFTKIVWTYTEYDGAGHPNGQVTAGWDLAANRPVD